MSSQIAFPFLTLSASSVRAEKWLVSLDGSRWDTAEDYLQDWDYASTVFVRRCIYIDKQAASQELGMSRHEATYQIRTRIGTGSGRLPRIITRATVANYEEVSGNSCIEVKIDGSQLSTVLDLHSEVVLAQKVDSTSRISPRHAGDRLWQDRKRIRLEGEETRFPIQIVNLRKMLGNVVAARAPWYLHWSRDWSRDLHGAFQLFLNEEYEEVINRVKVHDPLILQAILGSTITQVCEAVLTDPDFDKSAAELDDGAIGAQALSWIEQAWPGKDLEYVRTIHENRPGLFHSTLIALAEVSDKS